MAGFEVLGTHMNESHPKRRLTYVSLACAMVLAALAGGCSTKVKPNECAALVAADAVDAAQLWECNREIMTRAAKRKKFTIQEFESASEFFGSLTGISADSRSTPVGPVPGKGIKEDLREWDAWLEEHTIYWDPSEGKVRVAEDEGA
jgi:hypothetical protein